MLDIDRRIRVQRDVAVLLHLLAVAEDQHRGVEQFTEERRAVGRLRHRQLQQAFKFVLARGGIVMMGTHGKLQDKIARPSMLGPEDNAHSSPRRGGRSIIWLCSAAD